MEDILFAAEIIVAEIELSYKQPVNPGDCPRVYKCKDSYHLFIHSWDQKRIDFVEEFRIMVLNSDNRVLGMCTVPRGACVPTIIEPKLVFAVAVKAYSDKIVVARNSKTGKVEPGLPDKDLCKALVRGGAILGIRVADYLIVSQNNYYSFAFEGVL